MGIFGKIVLQSGMGSIDLTLLQNYVVILLLFVYYAVMRLKPLKLTLQDLKSILLQGLLGSAPVFIFYYLCLEHINASVACLLLFTNPIFITVYFIVFEGQKNSWQKMLAIAMALIGSIFVLNIMPGNIGKLDLLGIFFGVVSSISYAFYNVHAEKKLTKYQPGVILFYCSIVVAAAASVLNPGFYKLGFINNYKAVYLTVIIAVVSGILPVVFLYKSIGILGAQIVSVAATLEIPITMLMSVLILGERLSMIQLIGSMLIIASIILLKQCENGGEAAADGD